MLCARMQHMSTYTYVQAVLVFGSSSVLGCKTAIMNVVGICLHAVISTTITPEIIVEIKKNCP